MRCFGCWVWEDRTRLEEKFAFSELGVVERGHRDQNDALWLGGVELITPPNQNFAFSLDGVDRV